MRVTKLDLTDPPGNLLRAIQDAEAGIHKGVKGQLTESQIQEARDLSAFLPDGTEIVIHDYLDEDENQTNAPRRYKLVPERDKAIMSGYGDKLFAGYTLSTFLSGIKGKGSTVTCATIAHLWMPNAAFHVHGNEIGDMNDGLTFEDYEVAGGGPAWYLMGKEVYYVEPDKDPEAGIYGWEIPPGMFHAVFSEDLNNPALAVLRFHKQGLALRKYAEHQPQGWGFPRDEKVYTFASRAIQSMIEIAQGKNPAHNLPQSFVESVSSSYGHGVLGKIT